MAYLVSSSPAKLCCLYRSLCLRTSRALYANGFGQSSWCSGEGAAAVCRKTNYPCCDGTRGLFSHGGGAAVEQQTLKDIARNIREQHYKRVVVMAGAGISTPSGIPDFRSPGSGLYDNLQQYDLPYAEAIFEIDFFHQNPNPFFALAKELYPGNYQPNLTHYFVRLLHKKGQLLRMYTQNIDGLERLAGIPPEILVEAHGTFATATCTVCLRKYEGKDLRELPRHFFKYFTDFPLADLLIIMGTSLEVEPFASLSGAVRSSVPRLLINRDLVGPFAWSRRPHDVVQLGDVVSGVQALVDSIGWTQELDALMSAAAEKATKKTGD
uniref:NAD-dependent protein deacetylase sirtuin-3, mitochondrial isoform X2 n=1 Tax=Monopterus albus TaxID=43700 RepID=UPI0009B31048|nr:NAD-dependent protein deacetylase sirtuin-3, mitochondrial isoform X2 [Monopterus albus]